MCDIFISYKREDRPRAKQLAAKLEEEGFSVWWDRNIPPGKSFDQVIQEALDEASCVVVLWSKLSVQSDWVKEEAEKGKSRGVLVPILIDDVPIPLGFGRIQTADLVDWQGEGSHPELQRMLKSIAQMLGRSNNTFALVRELLLGPEEKGPKATPAEEAPEQACPIRSSGVSQRRWALPAATMTLLFASAAFISARTGLLPRSLSALEAPVGSEEPAAALTQVAADREDQGPASPTTPRPRDGRATDPADPPAVGTSTREGSSPGSIVGSSEPVGAVGAGGGADVPAMPGGDELPARASAPSESSEDRNGSPTVSGKPRGSPETPAKELAVSTEPIPVAAVDPAVAAYKMLSELQERAFDPAADAADLLRSYESLWSQFRQHLDSDAAARVFRKLESLREAVELSDSLPDAQALADWTVTDRLRYWQELAARHPAGSAGARIAANIRELEKIVDTSATLTAPDRFVACEGVARSEGSPVAPIGIRESFRPGPVWIFAWVHSPRAQETLSLEWRNEDGAVERTQKVSVSRDTGSGYRIAYGKDYSEPGCYEVRLFNEAGALIGRRAFSVES